VDTLFRKFGLVTILAVIFLIFVGGIVRATGSGMGCPDWPKCFGLWIPPTHADQLPLNYQEIYGAHLKGEVVFNSTKTWIEYINRLIGVLIGFFIFITFILSYLAYFKTNKKIVFLSFLSFILVGFEGWLGSKVVSTELHPFLITLHMLVSIVILGLLIWAILSSYKSKLNMQNIIKDKSFSFVLILSFVLMVGQVIFGTQIREGIDLAQISLGDSKRAEWVSSVFGKVLFHGGLGLLILILQGILLLKSRNLGSKFYVFKWTKLCFYSVLISFFSGAILGFFNFPAMFQPVHLVFASIILSLQFVIYFLLEPEII
jgi:heme a synthase